MSIFYKIQGHLWFETEAQAEKYYDELRADDESMFSYYADNLQLSGRKISFWERGNFCSATLFLSTQDLIVKITSCAARGRVDFSEGESDRNYYTSYISPSVLRGREKKRRRQMSKRGIMEYALKGKFEFSDEETAGNLFEKLSAGTAENLSLPSLLQLQGRKPNLAAAGNTIIFDDRVFAKNDYFEKLKDLLREIAAQAVAGKIDIEQADVVENKVKTTETIYANERTAV